MSSLLFGIGPLDAPTYLAALGVLLAAAAFASDVPARRAASIDPVETLKTEDRRIISQQIANTRPARASSHESYYLARPMRSKGGCVCM